MDIKPTKIVSQEYLWKKNLVKRLKESGMSPKEAGAYSAFKEMVLYGVTIDLMLQDSELSQAMAKAWDLASEQKVPWGLFRRELGEYIDRNGYPAFVEHPDEFVNGIVEKLRESGIDPKKSVPLWNVDPIYDLSSPASLRGELFWDAPEIPREDLSEEEARIFNEYLNAYIELQKAIPKWERESLKREILNSNPELAEEAIREYFEAHKQELLERIR